MKNYNVWLNDQKLKVYPTTVSAIPFNMVWAGRQRSIDQTEEAYFVTFDMTEPVKVEIEVQEPFEKFEIRPLSYDLNAHRNGSCITLTVEKPMQFSVEIDGSHNALHVFANPVSEKPAGDVIYYGPGEHKADLIWLESNQTLYLDEGAIVYGAIYAKDAENIRIMGRGILDSSLYRRGEDTHEGGREIIEVLQQKNFPWFDIRCHSQLVLHNCKNCYVEGITLRDAQFWSAIVRNNSENITLDNIKIIGQWRYNSDGIDICASTNVKIINSFVRAFDDCIVMRGAHMEGESENVDNVLVDNCVLWCDWGKSLECWCGYKPTEIKNILFRNCYLTHLNATAMNITVWYGSNYSVVNGVAYENIEIDIDEDYLHNELESNVPSFTEKWGYIPYAVKISVEKLGKNIGNQQCETLDDESGFYVYFGNISFKNVKYYGAKKDLTVLIKKYSDIHTIENVTAENCDFVIKDNF